MRESEGAVTAGDIERTGRITTALDVRKETAWVLRMGAYGARALATVVLLALVFTMVNVQQFAADGHPVNSLQWWIAWLLDPMASVTMGTAIVFEGVLASYRHQVGWLAATKWFAGICTWAMNIWSSAVAVSWSGMVLHSVAPGLVLLLAEAAPRVRRSLSEIVSELERRGVDVGRARLAAEQARHQQREAAARRRADGELVTAEDVLAKATGPRRETERERDTAAVLGATTETEVAATQAAVERPAKSRRAPTVTTKAAQGKRPVASREQRRQWVREQRAAGRNPTGAEVDEEFGPPGIGSKSRTGAAIVAEVDVELRRAAVHAVGGSH
ncbi:MAG: hypothetical protein ACRDQX_14795 [Pseudonocardiaceae bacterium]